jgi:hypothetical protein
MRAASLRLANEALLVGLFVYRRAAPRRGSYACLFDGAAGMKSRAAEFMQ